MKKFTWWPQWVEKAQLKKKISDDGARAITAKLVEPSAIKSIDLLEINIGMMALKLLSIGTIIVGKVLFTAEEKIEAMGTTDAVSDSAIFLAVTSICVVDVLDNRPKEAGQTSLYQINFEVYKENVMRKWKLATVIRQWVVEHEPVSTNKNTAKKKINTFLNCSLPRMSSLKINIYLGYLHPADKIFSVQN